MTIRGSSNTVDPVIRWARLIREQPDDIDMFLADAEKEQRVPHAFTLPKQPDLDVARLRFRILSAVLSDLIMEDLATTERERDTSSKLELAKLQADLWDESVVNTPGTLEFLERLIGPIEDSYKECVNNPKNSKFSSHLDMAYSAMKTLADQAGETNPSDPKTADDFFTHSIRSAGIIMPRGAESSWTIPKSKRV